MNNHELEQQLGSAIYESHGPYFKELLEAGYNINDFYDGGYGWGNVSKVLAMVSYIRGVRSYVEYVSFYEMVKQPGDGGALTPRAYARLTGIKAKPVTQTDRTRSYRQRRAKELIDLRELTAVQWIEEHPEQAIDIIKTRFSHLLSK